MCTTETCHIDDWSQKLEEMIRSALHDIRFGTVTLVIQNGRVIQIEKNEKIRLKKPTTASGSDAMLAKLIDLLDQHC